MSPGALLRALRPHQWSKNLFVLAALVFAAGEHGLEEALARGHGWASLVAFAAFCLASSAVYLVNDVLDVERDRAHPEKRKRPIASGQLAIPAALACAGLCFALGLALAGWHGGGRANVLLLAGYGLLNLAYSTRLKHVVLVDAFCIAAGFLLRLAAGGNAAEAEISRWAFLCTLFLALFLALNKRRAELGLLGEAGASTRASLQHYTLGFLDQMVSVLAACTIVAYTMYTVDPETVRKFGTGAGLFWSVPFVAFGIGRYMVLVQSGRGGENPARILLGGDGWFLANTLAWAAVVGHALFGAR
ncbi:MAG TPA: decaprenyl-phosphate phosphoribosyltransferase [Planctomycetota bacterium]